MKNKFNIQYRTQQMLVSAIVFATGFMLLFGLFQSASAQIIRTNPPSIKPTPTPTPQRKILVFKGTAAEEKLGPEFERFKNLPMPTVLSSAEKQNSFNEAMLENGFNTHFVVLPYAFLTARNPYVKDRAALSFFNPYGVVTLEGIGNFATYGFDEGGKESGFTVSVKPTKIGQWFMVDCSLSVADSRKFNIKMPDGSLMEKTVSGTEHLQVFFLSQKIGWHYFSFNTPPGTPWMLSSCEVTTPN